VNEQLSICQVDSSYLNGGTDFVLSQFLKDTDAINPSACKFVKTSGFGCGQKGMEAMSWKEPDIQFPVCSFTYVPLCKEVPTSALLWQLFNWHPALASLPPPIFSATRGAVYD
jgi:hypothetical protein